MPLSVDVDVSHNVWAPRLLSLCGAVEVCRCVHVQPENCSANMRNMSLEVTSLPFHSSPPKGCKQANTPAPALFERSKNPRTWHFHGSFSESSQTSHLHPDSLVTYGCVCGNSLGILSCPQNLVFSSAHPPLQPPTSSSWVLRALIRAHLPVQAPISMSEQPCSCPHSVPWGIPTPQLPLIWSFPETLHFHVYVPVCSNLPATARRVFGW